MEKKFAKILKSKNLKIIEKCAQEFMNQIQQNFFSAPRLTWEEGFKNTKVTLELLTDIDMLLVVEKRIRGGLCHSINRYAKANNI